MIRQIRNQLWLIDLALLSSICHAESVDTSDIYGPGVTEALNAIIAARAELESWVLNGKCTVKYSDSDEICESAVYGAFDKSSNQFRFETKGSYRAAQLASGEFQGAGSNEERLLLSASRRRLHNSLSLIVKNRNFMLEWYGLGDLNDPERTTCNLELRDLDSPPSRIASLAFNPSAAGLIDVLSSSPMDSVKEILEKYSHGASVVTLEKGAENGIKIVYTYGRKARRLLFVDPENAFTVTHSIKIGLDESGNQRDFPVTESGAKWESKNGVQIPTGVYWSRSTSVDTISRTEYKIAWASINPKTIDEITFDYKDRKSVV